MAPPRRPSKGQHPPSRQEEHRDRPGAHQDVCSTSTTVTLTDKDGNVIAWQSAGSRRLQGLAQSTPFAAQVTADSAPRRAGARPPEGRGLRQRAGLRSRAAIRPSRSPARGARREGRFPAGAQRRPPRRSGGASSGPREPRQEVPVVPARGHEALPEGRALPDREVRGRASQLPAGRARARPHQAVRVPASAAREAEGTELSTGSSRSSSAATTRPRSAQGSRARSSCGCSSCGSTTSSTAWASPHRAHRRARSSGTVTSTVNGRRVNIRASRFGPTRRGFDENRERCRTGRAGRHGPAPHRSSRGSRPTTRT